MKLLTLVFFFFLILPNVQASTRLHGDKLLTTREEISEFILNSGKLKYQLGRILRTFVVDDIEQPDLRGQIAKMVREGFMEDIYESTYETAEHCYDKASVEHAASTFQGIKGSSVCFNLSFLSANGGVRESELLGLASHEHARHFSFEDTEDDAILGIRVHPIGHFFSGQAKLMAAVGLQPGYKMVLCRHREQVCRDHADQKAISCGQANELSVDACILRRRQELTNCMSNTQVCEMETEW